ncbi:WhiB family transcriptional regulator [Streptomyces sp. DH37]|uniref:WhiB family transcriptional regulator n=1 Tax=Streptomyces sp. DH37 TaxID=3040122 RepID=UPI002442D5E0|nr:WhiB family transcriptional regulator [Streptomyces sp. DH37]MDG9701715.1 WhiB family transcriptional regulator [Streptomyces sp. DH37]
MARPDMSWQDSALCAQTGPDPFYPTKGGTVRDAKRICGRCEVKDSCLDDALATGDDHGIRAGLTARERRKLRRQQHAA